MSKQDGTGRRRSAPGRRNGADPVPRPATAREAFALGMAGLAVLLLTLPPSDWQPAVMLPCALALAACAIGLAVRALGVKRAADPRPAGAVPALIVGSITMVVAISVGTAYLVTPELREYNECMLGANTGLARSDC